MLNARDILPQIFPGALVAHGNTGMIGIVICSIVELGLVRIFWNHSPAGLYPSVGRDDVYITGFVDRLHIYEQPTGGVYLL